MHKTLWSSGAIFLLAACGTTLVGSRYVLVQPVASATGGTVAVTEAQSAALAGTALDIPAGALASGTAFTAFTVEPGLYSLVETDELVSPAVLWGPIGVTLASPATMRLPVTLRADDAAAALEAVQEDDSGEVTTLDVTLDASRTRASFKVSRLGTFQVRRRVPCGASSGCPSGSVCSSAINPAASAPSCRPNFADGGIRRCLSTVDCGAAQICIAGVCELRCGASTTGRCARDGGPTPDAGPRPDGGPITWPDAGPTPDAGPRPDGGPITWPDAGPRPDGGPITWPDAGPRPDGGPITWPDAGPRPDGGPITWPDAGPIIWPDAGQPDPGADGGVQFSDAG